MAIMSKKHDATIDDEAGDDEASALQSSRSVMPVGGNGSSRRSQKKRGMTTSTFWREMFSFGVYKRQQGRIARQATFGALLFTFGVGCFRLSQILVSRGSFWQIGIPLALFAVSAWLAYRLVNYPSFADFLIAVEAEMAKVSWPTRTELYRSSLVVMFTIFGLAALLWLYDLSLHWFLTELLRIGK